MYNKYILFLILPFMTQSSFDSSTLNLENDASLNFQTIENKAIKIANKLQSGFALNQENYEFLLNNFTTRLNHKKFMTDEDKEFMIDWLSPLIAQNKGETIAPSDMSKAQLKAIENLETFIAQKQELRDALEQSVVENQNALIEEEKVIEFLERNNTSTLEELDTHLQSANPSELLTSIFEINESLGEKDKIENNPSLYLSSGGMFGGLSKLKVSLFSDKPHSITTLQGLVNQYENKKELTNDLKNLKTYLLQTASLEIAVDEAEKKLNEKRKAIEELISSIEGGQKKMASLDKELRNAQNQLTQLLPETTRLNYKEVSEYLLENLSSLLNPDNLQIDKLKEIFKKTYGPHFEAELPNIIETYESVNTDVAQTVEGLENVIQLNQAQKKQYEFALKRSFSEEEKQAHQSAILSNQAFIFSSLEKIEQRVASFFKSAFDSNMSDYLDKTLAQNEDLKSVKKIIEDITPVLSSLEPYHKNATLNGEGGTKNKI